MNHKGVQIELEIAALEMPARRTKRSKRIQEKISRGPSGRTNQKPGATPSNARASQSPADGPGNMRGLTGRVSWHISMMHSCKRRCLVAFVVSINKRYAEVRSGELTGAQADVQEHRRRRRTFSDELWKQRQETNTMLSLTEVAFWSK